ncbi:FecR domain-containing protein [Devosia sp.]|uniref:FecR family protein n=1 Tax=Devosia sp. TaxID=1871048 RepID=UPI0035B124F2
MRAPISLFVAVFAVLLGAPALAASGVAMGVDQNATLEAKAGTRVLAVGSDVFIGDKVVTDASGLVELRFSDRTRLVIGPRSSLVIDDYLLREDGSAGKFAVNALAGTFRFITGGAAKDRYLITTPTGTVGVRGTAFDLNVDAQQTSLLLFHGAVILCTLDDKCVVVDEVCELGQANTAEALVLGLTDDIRGQAREALRTRFPYANSQSELLAAFRLEQARRCLNRPVTVPEQDPVSNVGEPEKYRGPFILNSVP